MEADVGQEENCKEAKDKGYQQLRSWANLKVIVSQQNQMEWHGEKTWAYQDQDKHQEYQKEDKHLEKENCIRKNTNEHPRTKDREREWELLKLHLSPSHKNSNPNVNHTLRIHLW